MIFLFLRELNKFKELQIRPRNFIWLLTHKQMKTYGCVLGTKLEHQAISTHSAD